jgi:MFS family permease
MVKNLENNIKKFYAFCFFRELMFIIPVVVLFWQQNGLSLTQIMILQSLYAITIVLLQVPTGFFADKFGRKYSLALGAIFLLGGALTYSLGYNFWQFIIAETIWAFGGAFISGADTALIYDTLKQTKKEEKFKKIWGNVKSFQYFASALSAIIGGFVAYYSLRLNWILISISMFFVFIISLSLSEPKHTKILEKKNYWRHSYESFGEVFKNKSLLFILLFGALISVGIKISTAFYQPFMNAIGVKISYFGVIWALFGIFSIIGSKYSFKIEEKFKGKISLWLIIITLCLSLVLMSIFFVILGILFIFIQQFFVNGFAQPVIQDYANKNMSSEKRATLLSIQNMSERFLFAILAPFYGFIADKFSLSNALLISGITLFVALSILMIIKRSKIINN